MVFLDSIARVVWGRLGVVVKGGTNVTTAILFKIPGIHTGHTALGCFGLGFSFCFVSKILLCIYITIKASKVT